MKRIRDCQINDKNGYSYIEKIIVTKKEFKLLKKAIAIEIELGYPLQLGSTNKDDYKRYLVPMNNRIENIVFLNLTQSRFLNAFLKSNMSYGMNVCLEIKF